MPTRDVWVIATRRKPSRRAIRATYLRFINGAVKAIDLVNAYFVPDWRIRRALIRAVGRGVRVRVMVPEVGDLRFVQWAVEGTLERLVRGGVQAFAYRQSVLHSKTAVVDDRLVTIGSYNLDNRSFRFNLEVNLAVRSVAFADVVRDSIERDLKMCTPWTTEVLLARGVFRRIMSWVALLFARFL